MRVRRIDQHIGEQLRITRLRRGRSLASLASDLSIEAEDLNAYEMGLQINAATLGMLAAALNVPIARFFEDVKPGQMDDQPPGLGEMDKALLGFPSSETAQLLRAWKRLDVAAQRRALRVVQIVAGAFTDQAGR